MARLNWVELLTKHRVPYIERGANVKSGEVNIKCPMCGSADPSYHMGLNLTHGAWACWRNAAHRGRSPVRLIMALLNLPYWQARELAGLGTDFVDPEGFSALAARLRRGEPQAEVKDRRKAVSWPRDAVPLSPSSNYQAWRYLTEVRGFGRDSAELVELYDLRVSSSGPWRDRILIPYYLDGNLVTWTGRYCGKHAIRYRDLETTESVRAPKETLFNIDALHEPTKVLLGVEGPFDALKLDFYGRDVGVRTVAFSTNSMTEDQLYMLDHLADNAQALYVMHDQTNTATGAVHGLRLKARISHIAHAKTIEPPFGAKDGGELTRSQAIKFTDELASNT